MTLSFPYRGRSRAGGGATAAKVTAERLRPVIPMRLHGPYGFRNFVALVDTGADRTLFDHKTAESVGVSLDGDPGWVRWRGREFLVERGPVIFRISDGVESWAWRGKAGFVSNPKIEVDRPLLGHAGFLEFMNARFLGPAHTLELDWASSHPCSIEKSEPPRDRPSAPRT